MTTQAITVSKSSTQSRVLWIAAFAILTGLSSLVKIPLGFTPVPVSLQTAVVILSGVILGRDALWAQGLYLLLGGIGLPFFTPDTPGVQVLFGATGGYLLGFVFAAAFIGYKIRPQWNNLPIWKRTAFLLASSMLIFIPGVIQLKFVAGVSFARALELGFYPFMLGDVIKSLVVSFVPSKFTLNR
ncbi:MAG: biotin transporter BioY [Proteobacteria bacterium]|nr:biotin transporter BioY [Pseudomonadota bacterium]